MMGLDSLQSIRFPALSSTSSEFQLHPARLTLCRITVSGATEKAVKAARDEMEFITAGAPNALPVGPGAAGGSMEREVEGCECERRILNH